MVDSRVSLELPKNSNSIPGRGLRHSIVLKEPVMGLTKRWVLAIVFLISAQWVRGDQERPVEDIWNSAYLGGHKAGYVHTNVTEIERQGRKLFRTITKLSLTVMRETERITLGMEMGTDEYPDGRVAAVCMRQLLGTQQQMILTGTVEGNELHIKVTGGMHQDKRIPWNDQVIGLYRQERLFQDRHVKPGDTLSYLSFESAIGRVVNTHVQVKGYENVKLRGSNKRVLRVEATPDKIGDFQLPTLVTWLGDDLNAVRAEVPVPGIGTMLLERTSEAEAKRPNDAVAPQGINSLVALDRAIAQPYRATSAVYRITVKNDDNPATAFVQDGRQQIRNINGNSFELHVQASRRPGPARQPAEKIGEEFLASSFFITSDDPLVRRRAAEAVGQSVDPWEKARKIERYVHDRMENKNLSQAFATADEVARTMEGDCTEHAVLAAAMCRAVGVPSRTAIGLVYVNHVRRGPSMGFHMWAEVWIDGQWIPIDATMGQGFVGASHIKITDHSWYKTETLTPLLPVLRVLDKLKIEVVRVDGN
jgi:hypothetical protein